MVISVRQYKAIIAHNQVGMLVISKVMFLVVQVVQNYLILINLVVNQEMANSEEEWISVLY